MKEGYIACNMTNFGDGFEIFGVYRKEKYAQARLKKVIRTRFGRCPRDFEEALSFADEQDGNESSYRVVWFCENDGSEDYC